MSSPRILPLVKSSSFRFAITIIGMIWGAVAALLVLLYLVIRSTLLLDMEQRLDAELTALQSQLTAGEPIEVGLDRWYQSRSHRIVQIVTPTGTETYELPKQKDIWQGNLAAQPERPYSTETLHLVEIDYKDYKGLLGWKEIVTDEGVRLRVGLDADYLERVDSASKFALTVGLFLTLILAVFGSLVLTRTTLMRIATVNQTCQEIMQGDLSQRVPVSSRDDDFDKLASQINAMLGQIQRLMAGIHQVSDNIAHDLKTPLTRLRTMLESIQRQANTKQDDSVESAIREADRLLAIFNGLLRLSRLESGSVRVKRERFCITQLLQDIEEFYEPVAEENRQTLLLMVPQRPLYMKGDVDLWFQVIANLVDNALKYTPSDGAISLSLTQVGGYWELAVIDSGPGVPDSERSKVFDRFYRMERHRGSSGNGLGLSLVKVVADLHAVELRLADACPGLKVVLRLPAVEAEP